MSTALLEPPVTTSALPSRDRPEAVWEGPLWIRTDRGSYWHRPRSGAAYPRTDLRPMPYVAYHLWCGGSAFSHRMHSSAEEVPPGFTVCATCEGRAVGAGHPSFLGGPEGLTTFRPRGLEPPSRCPGTGTVPRRMLTHCRGICDVCGKEERCRATGSPWRGSWGLQAHPPGPGLILGCAFHRWDRLVIAAGAVVCECDLAEGAVFERLAR